MKLPGSTFIYSLYLFVELATRLSVSEVAKNEKLTPAKLRNLIKSLEIHLGMHLIYFHNGSCSLTDSGNNLLNDIDPLMRIVSASSSVLMKNISREKTKINVEIRDNISHFVRIVSLYTQRNEFVQVNLNSQNISEPDYERPDVILSCSNIPAGSEGFMVDTFTFKKVFVVSAAYHNL